MRAALSLIAAVAVLASAAGAQAQSVSPMETQVRSFGDRFLARLNIQNPYAESHEFAVGAFDEAGAPVAVWLSAETFTLAAGGRRQIMIASPFDGASDRRLVVCIETVAAETATSRIRGQVCAHVQARRLS